MTVSLSRRAVRLAVTTATTAAVLAGMLTTASVSTPALAAGAPTDAVNSAASYARSQGYQVGISVLDTRTGTIYHSGDYRSGFASESVIKVMIAARLIVQGRMHGSTATRASRMIRMSDDNIANSFYGSVGGDGLLDWTKKHFDVPSLGSGPIRSGWWGSNRLTSDGLVRLYAKLKADSKIGPWLLKAMHGHTKYGADGFYQAFGLPSASTNVAVKQGWGSDYSFSTPNASQNSTGYVNGDRYAVAILARGPASSYGSRIGNAITVMAKRLLPGGTFPNGVATVSSLTQRTGSTAGGYWIGVRGQGFSAANGVLFNSTKARFEVKGSTYLIAYVPAHGAGTVGVYVRTKAGMSPASAAKFGYGSPPTVVGLSSTSGPTAGGNTVVAYGVNVNRTTAVFLGPVRSPRFTVLSAHAVRVAVPASTAGTVHLRFQSAFGLSTPVDADRYTYAAPAAAAAHRPTTSTPTTDASPTSAPTTSAPATSAPATSAPATNTPTATPATTAPVDSSASTGPDAP